LLKNVLFIHGNVYNYNFTTVKFTTMKTIFTYIALATLVTSCSTYKSGQTPDDLYYAKPPVAAVEEKKREVRDEVSENYQDRVEERNIRFGINNRRWRSFDEYDYNYNCRYNPYAFGYNSPYYFNPYFHQYPVFTTFTNNTVKGSVRMTNLNAYNGTITSYTNTKFGTTVRTNTVRSYNTPSTQPARTYRTRSVSVDRTYSPGNSGWGGSGGSRSSGGSSSSGGGGSVSRPTRGGR
jgi:uncharacterized membrane protein YgcG